MKARESVPLFPSGDNLLSSFLYELLYFDLPFTLYDCCLNPPICISAPDPFPCLVLLFFSFQLPFGEGLFHLYPQDTSKRRSKRSARRRQQLQKDKRVRIHMTMKQYTVYTCAVTTTAFRSLHVKVFFLYVKSPK